MDQMLSQTMIQVQEVPEIDEHKREEFSILMEPVLFEFDRGLMVQVLFLEHLLRLLNDKIEDEDGGMEYLIVGFQTGVHGAVLERVKSL